MFIVGAGICDVKTSHLFVPLILKRTLTRKVIVESDHDVYRILGQAMGIELRPQFLSLTETGMSSSFAE